MGLKGFVPNPFSPTTPHFTFRFPPVPLHDFHTLALNPQTEKLEPQYMIHSGVKSFTSGIHLRQEYFLYLGFVCTMKCTYV